jgi:hypothetical protein
MRHRIEAARSKIIELLQARGSFTGMTSCVLIAINKGRSTIRLKDCIDLV